MESIEVQGYVDGEHHLSASVPGSFPPGPVTVVIKPSSPEVDDVDAVWMAAVARKWAEDLADARQDIYTLEDGELLEDVKFAD